ncbi:hypothetical protein [Carboxylicivirga sp. N1Y90]|uniref:hypothetical protein n=1 Tax=Carboxylicivirga fragile TaxID=3417571 RepID=UPI003D324871|nr:hypothetical protein [Marinilabiliaceae bacterium N1Y90]
MKKVLIALGLITCLFVQAQTRVMLESGSTSTVFDGDQPFIDAYDAAVNGDIIYLPGGGFTVPTLIDKGIKIIGVGHFPSATTATNATVLAGDLFIGENADNLHIEGCDLGNYDINFTSDHKVDDVNIVRCKLGTLQYQGSTNPCVNNTIRECIITETIYFTNAVSSTLANSIVHQRIYYGTDMSILNCILLYDYNNSNASYSPIRDVDNSLISSNIFFKDYNGFYQDGCESSTFTNNVFFHNPTAGSNTFTNNYIIGENASNILVNQSGNIFDYSHDYHLASPATYTNGDGLKAGIYGGIFPFKADAIPSTPHISVKNMAGSTDENGLLNVSITVTAQDE